MGPAWGRMGPYSAYSGQPCCCCCEEEEDRRTHTIENIEIYNKHTTTAIGTHCESHETPLKTTENPRNPMKNNRTPQIFIHENL